MSGRLTKQLREAMLNTVLDHAFLDKAKQAKDSLLAAGDNLYIDYHGDHLKTMQKLPTNYLYKKSRMDTNIGGQRHIVHLGESKPMSYESNHSRIVFQADNTIAIAWLRANDNVNDINKQQDSMRREVSAVLESVHTFKKLFEVWPECKPLLDKFEQKPTIAILPAIQVKSLNEKLGLPSGK